MMTTQTTVPCKCGNCPAVRLARGLTPFCQYPPSPPRDMTGIYGSYRAAAAAAKPGQRVRSITVSGGPKRFVLEAV